MSLTGNTEKLNSLITKINALPDAGEGGSGGASVETCTVTISTSGTLTNIVAMVYTDGAYGVAENSGVSTCTVENVVKGSIIAFRSSSSVSLENATLYTTVHTDDFSRVSVFAALAG